MKKFVSHSHQDNALVVPFVEDLRNAGVDVWVDLEQIDQDDFIKRMNDGLAQSDWVVLVQTPNALPARSSAVEMVVGAALGKKLRRTLRDVIPFIMAPCDPNEVPDIWQALHHYDAVRDGYATALAGLLRALGVSAGPRTVSPVLTARLPGTGAAQPALVRALAFRGQDPSPPWDESAIATDLYDLGFRGWRVWPTGVEFLLPPTCDVAGGPFVMGSAPDDKQAHFTEQPHYRIPVAAFQIGTFPVSVVEYTKAVQAGAVPAPPTLKFPDEDWVAPAWRGKELTWAQQQQQRSRHPVVGMDWFGATGYAAWLAKVTGQPWRLPTEAEWEKAARWDPQAQRSRIWPWGDDFGDGSRANTRETGPKMTTPVGTYPQGASPCGAQDMAGNVWEWCRSLFKPYPYDASVSDDHGDRTSAWFALRGGSWDVGSSSARAAFRYVNLPDYLGYDGGFRLVRVAGAGA